MGAEPVGGDPAGADPAGGAASPARLPVAVARVAVPVARFVAPAPRHASVPPLSPSPGSAVGAGAQRLEFIGGRVGRVRPLAGGPSRAPPLDRA